MSKQWDDAKEEIKDVLLIILLLTYISSSIVGLSRTGKMDIDKVEELIELME